MALRSILVVLDSSEQSDRRLALAIGLARRYGGHLCGLAVIDVPELAPSIVFGGTEESSSYGVMAALKRIRQHAYEEAGQIETVFWEAVKREDLSAEWRRVEGYAPPVVVGQSRCFDLVIVGQADPDGKRPETGRAIISALLMTSGRPLLIVPYAGRFERIGETAVIGWNSSREAARAAHDAIPLLESARSVTVLTVEGRGRGQDHVPGAEMTHQLARHGISAVAADTVSGEVPDGIALLNYVSDSGADLLVVGGYGHSRAREFVFGGVTRTCLESMTVPVLMSH